MSSTQLSSQTESHGCTSRDDCVLWCQRSTKGEAEKKHFSLKPADSGVTETDSRTHLEIVRQVSAEDYASS